MTQQTLYRRLRALRDGFTPPPGLTWPEISDGKLVMMLRPGPRHQLTAMLVRRQLDAQLPEGLGVFEATDTDAEALGVLRVPDLHVCREAAMDSDGPLDPREILLAVEIVSPSNPENDYRDKARDYPAMGIPRYLILDPRDGTWTYQWGIVPGEERPAYGNRLRLSYGEPVGVVTEFGVWEVGTGGLPRYGGSE
ncbi:Uma2 family endonuclease [Streptomyces niveiscabiei]|uniref:Uma2 family endonuclease n=1 Tax=Streptomyces niveiscabiei TaxID=164115 RepID=UPI0029A49EED|nr:Uma2 family endonuclease [Streptomyces niveiscabiei]MDX3387716.1 Uma2 family endonuclease [Streptomyces niveiscabiei]